MISKTTYAFPYCCAVVQAVSGVLVHAHAPRAAAHAHGAFDEDLRAVRHRLRGCAGRVGFIVVVGVGGAVLRDARQVGAQHCGEVGHAGLLSSGD